MGREGPPEAPPSDAPRIAAIRHTKGTSLFYMETRILLGVAVEPSRWNSYLVWREMKPVRFSMWHYDIASRHCCCLTLKAPVDFSVKRWCLFTHGRS